MEQIILRKSKETDIYEVIERNPLSEAEKARLLYESRQKMEWDNQAREQSASDNRALTIAKNMLLDGESVEKIIKFTNLPREEVEGLRNAE